jgi:hypothetical protein
MIKTMQKQLHAAANGDIVGKIWAALKAWIGCLMDCAPAVAGNSA